MGFGAAFAVLLDPLYVVIRDKPREPIIVIRDPAGWQAWVEDDWMLIEQVHELIIYPINYTIAHSVWCLARVDAEAGYSSYTKPGESSQVS